MEEIYDKYCEDMQKDPDFRSGDKFLYLKISFENTFG